MEKLFSIYYPGLNHIGEKILRLLIQDRKSLLTSRRVCHSWKIILDNPRFWLEHLENINTNYYYSDKIYAQWKSLVQLTEKTHLKQNITFLLMKSKDNNVETPLHMASYVGDLDVVQYILQNMDQTTVMMMIKDELYPTPIYGAAKNGHLEIVKSLLPFSLEGILWTAIIYPAASNNHWEILQVIMPDLGQNIDFTKEELEDLKIGSNDRNINIIENVLLRYCFRKIH